MHALALDLRALAFSARTRLASVVAWVLQPPSVRRAFANPATLWGSAHADLTTRERDDFKAEAWRTTVLISVHLTFATTAFFFLAFAPVEPQLRVMLSCALAWFLLSAALIRAELVMYTTVRELNIAVEVVTVVVAMVQRMYGPERVAAIPSDVDRFMHVIADHPPSIIVIVFWLSSSSWQRFVTACTVLVTTFLCLSPSKPLNAVQTESIATLVVTGLSTCAGLLMMKWASKSLLNEVCGTLCAHSLN